ncbi:MAG: carbonic anhydrase family protein [Aureibaculum sp.]|jgi:carbonic anhydrase
MKVHTKITQANLTPQLAHEILVEGNDRFVKNVKAQRNLQQQVLDTSKGQYPFAVILSCIDSRVPAELVFDQGIGDIFSARVAGNIVNEDVLGSMEYACKVAGSKIVVVLGHTGCGAVTAACNHVEMGNITALLNKIQPAVKKIKPKSNTYTEKEIEEVASLNVKLTIERIRKESPILNELEKNNEIEIVGAKYNLKTGKVTFFDRS